ncbi:hypothetical protein QJR28_02330 [Clostridium baratii]|uniref:hypothetical protein n=1 Tax=Clostridium baratii TaxID=1561 RepID=UPI0030CDB86D
MKLNKEEKLNTYKHIFSIYQEECDAETIEKLYKHIKEEYLKKLEDGNLDINSERIRIEMCLGKHRGESKDFDLNRIGIIIILIPILIGLIEDYIKAVWENTFLQSIFMLIIILVIIYMILKIDSVNKDAKMDFVNYISLIVLKDIENGIVR